MAQENKKIIDRINLLRQLFKKHNLDGYIQPRADSFLGEYVPKSSARLEWISGFSGSAGEILILNNKCILFVDSRYILQAKEETRGTKIEVCLSSEIPLKSWIKNNIKTKTIKIGIDPWIYSYSHLNNLVEFGKNNNINFIKNSNNLIDQIWTLNRINSPKTQIKKHAIRYAGIKTRSKINYICEILNKNNVDAYIISQPESLAWLLNIRGSDLPHTPIVLLRAILLRNKKLYLFTNKNRINQGIHKYFNEEIKNLTIYPENKILDIVSIITKNKKSIWVDPKTTPHVIAECANKYNNLYEKDCPIEIKKAIKNKVEIKGAISAHKKDGVALCKFIYWLKNSNYNKLNELSVAKKIDSLRKIQSNFLCTSFETISGFSSNGAVVHYRVSKKSSKKFLKNGMYLCDSGGQYLEGTTDVTRTIIIGQPTKQMKLDFTIVLKSHIALATAKFPIGTTGNELDIIARTPLWKNEMHYGHGTGHGVGSCLSVHEGPQRISKGSFIPIEAGMIVSNEPGFYRTNKYGIRIENLILAVKDSTSVLKDMLEFKTLTLAPIDLELIEYALMSNEEISWINNYHSNVYKEISQKLSFKEKQWLKKACRPIPLLASKIA